MIKHIHASTNTLGRLELRILFIEQYWQQHKPTKWIISLSVCWRWRVLVAEALQSIFHCYFITYKIACWLMILLVLHDEVTDEGESMCGWCIRMDGGILASYTLLLVLSLVDDSSNWEMSCITDWQQLCQYEVNCDWVTDVVAQQICLFPTRSSASSLKQRSPTTNNQLTD